MASIASSSIPLITHTKFQPQSLANTAWAFSPLALCHRPLLDSISSSSRPKITQFNGQALENSAWAYANLELRDVPLLKAIASAAIAMIHALDLCVSADFPTLHAVALRLVGLAWGLSMLNIEVDEFSTMVASSLYDLGCHIDDLRLNAPQVIPRREDSRLTRAEMVPEVASCVRGMLVASKPTGWEIDGATTDGNVWTAQRMSIFLQGFLLQNEHPLNYDADLNYGFIHRLDVLSSGLVLCGTSFAGLYEIQRQLSTHAINREYVVAVQNRVPHGLQEIRAKIDPAIMSREKSKVTEFGKPSMSYVTVLAHVLACGAPYSHIAIRIHTGRRHQIRVHLQYATHSPVADAGYPTRCVLLACGRAGRTVRDALSGPAPQRGTPVEGALPLEPYINTRLEQAVDATPHRARRAHADVRNPMPLTLRGQHPSLSC